MSVWQRRFWLFSLCISATPLQAQSIDAVGVNNGIGKTDYSSTGTPLHAEKEAADIVQGTLNNGLDYVIMKRVNAETGVAMNVQVRGGFLAEQRPGERGLAHLIEHLIYTSPTEKAPDDMYRFRSVGIPITQHDLAYGTTSWRESDYYNVTRTAEAGNVDAMLSLYREVLSGLIFRAESVDAQRQTVMQEMAERETGNKIYASYIAAVAPASPTDIIDAQNSDDVPSASIDTIRALYRRLYRPENTTIVIVGNVDPSAVAALIEKQFADWRGVGAPLAPAKMQTFRAEAIKPFSVSTIANGRRSAMITVTMPLSAPQPSRQKQAGARIMEMVAMRASSNRLAPSQATGVPGKYGAFIENGDQGHRLIMLWDNFDQGKWREALSGLAKTACALRQEGWTQKEWDDAKQMVLQDLEGRAAGMQNFEIARQFADERALGLAAIPPDELARLAKQWLPGVTVTQGNEWWRSQWQSGFQHVRVEGPELGELKEPISDVRARFDQAVADDRCKAGAGG